MCGRVWLPTDFSEIKIRLKFDDQFAAPNIAPSWNIAPTQQMMTAVLDPATKTRRPVTMRWGLIPSWAKDEKIGVSMFNARADTISEKAAFRGAWKAGRCCLIVTDGFYEWVRREVVCAIVRQSHLAGPAVPSAVPYEVRRIGNEPSKSPRTMYPVVLRRVSMLRGSTHLPASGG
jgi:putative SOS response-associated peptidase YedK